MIYDRKLSKHNVVVLLIFACTQILPAQNRSIRSYVPMLDTDGVHINAHGGGFLFYDGLYYWHGEHKIAGRAGNSAHVGVSCYSSKDLYNWKNEGIALKVSTTPGHDIEKGCVLERPKVIYNKNTNKFVMWFHLELKGKGYSAARTGVAVSDRPEGPFEFIRTLRPNAGQWPVNFPKNEQRAITNEQLEKIGTHNAGQRGLYLRRDFEGGQMARDMTLFVDDDDKAYHIHASEENQTIHISRLTDDYLDFSDIYSRVTPGQANEAPAICKYDGLYYLLSSGCTGWAPNAARSYASTDILGPWKSTGNPCVGINPHNNLGKEKTFGGQSTYLIPLEGRPGNFIAVFDIWRPSNQIDSRYLFLPAKITDQGIRVEWEDDWNLSYFD